MDWDTSALVRRVRDRTRLPATRPGYGDDDVLRAAYDELVSQVVPLLVAQQQEHLVSSGLVQLVEGQRDYRLPTRASGQRLRLVELEDVFGNPTSLTRFNPEDLAGMRPATSGELPVGFVVEGNLLRLYPKPQGVSGYGLRLRFYDRPGRLVLPPQDLTPGASLVVGVSGTDLQLVGLAWPPGLQGVDLVRGTPAFETLQADALGNVTGSTITLLDPTLAAQVQAGDYVCVPGTAPVPQVAPEWHPLLALLTAAAQLQAKGDAEAAVPLLEEVAQRREPLLKALARPRSDGNPQRQSNGKHKWGYGRGAW